MKTLRYLLIALAMASFLSVQAQGLAELPEAQMHSTSGMVYSGSTLPQAAVTGVTMTYSTTGDGKAYVPGRRNGLGGGGGSGEPGDRPEPYEDPIGDAAWPLMVLALMYVCVRAFRNKRTRA